jgi:glycosyltransferase 2 family protein
MRKVVITLVQAAITLGLLGWIFHDPEVRRGVAHALRGADPVWMVWAVAAAGVSVLAGGLRWFVFLRILGFRLTLGRTMAVAFVGMFFNLFLFGSIGGDAAKTACVSHGRTHLTPALLSVGMDHLSGFVVLLVLALTFTFARYEVFLETPLAAGMLGTLAAVLILTLLGLGLSLILARLNLGARVPLPSFARRKMVDVDAAFNAVARRWQMSLAGCAVSVVVILAYFLSFYCSGRSVGGGVPVTTFLTVMPVVDVVSSLPVSISGLGVREKSLEELLGIIAGVPVERAVLISLGGFAASLFWSLVGGVVFCFYRRSPDAASWHELRHADLAEAITRDE